MKKMCRGYFTEFDGENFYKIENYDCMEDFFITLASSSDIWNFCWSQGGITAGRGNSDHAIFPYYTADKLSDQKAASGPYTAIVVSDGDKQFVWEPFAALTGPTAAGKKADEAVVHNIYKNTNGTRIWFEAVNNALHLAFRYGWMSSAKFGIVRKSVITNLSSRALKCTVLDGCKNILPACIGADMQNTNSILLDAYKKTEIDTNKNAELALFSVSSILSDKAEPNEGLYANTCWFSSGDKILLSPDTVTRFFETGSVEAVPRVEGKRPSAFICRRLLLEAQADESWYQVFDTELDAVKIAALETFLEDRELARTQLESDIAECENLIAAYVGEADGVQLTADRMTCVHHSENVMFNIMRGGFFVNNGKILIDDFVKFIGLRNKAAVKIIKNISSAVQTDDGWAKYDVLSSEIAKLRDAQLTRLFYEYLPIAFSRRHGDPSRPWNRFNIKLRDDAGNLILNYEGNWRDIFQNWEALVRSYPQYIKNMCAKFLNAMTPEGFNPYRISREGVDWEVPDPDNPWAHIGYWGDHHVIYLQKLLEFYSSVNRKDLLASLNEKCYASVNIPYRIKSYAEILKNPRETIVFDRKLNDALVKKAQEYGSDAKLVFDESERVALISLAAKLLQIVVAKAANFIPGGGIWLNTQRPEWNDANNALAGYGLSMVTLCYLHRYIDFLSTLFRDAPSEYYAVPGEIADCFTELGALYFSSDPVSVSSDAAERKSFVDKAGLLFEKERNDLYAAGYVRPERMLAKADIIDSLDAINRHIKTTIAANKREDGLYHSYNILDISDCRMEISALQEMLEGQVAVLSAKLLSPEKSLVLLKTLRKSRMYEARQNTYMLYPDKKLPAFLQKNCVAESDIRNLSTLINLSGSDILAKDCNGIYHFNPEFRSARCMNEYLDKAVQKATTDEIMILNELYEKTFSHRSFTGRSGTFYAYEGLGSIYWHMVSKLLLAVQESVFDAKANNADKKVLAELAEAYYDIRSGLGFNKAPLLYGAFPADPYSHTPHGGGAKQPGMTGQVKEEVLTRWGELGVTVTGGRGSFVPIILRKSEFFDDGTLSFTWCAVPVTYHLAEENSIVVNNEIKRDGALLTEKETQSLFRRDGTIFCVDVYTTLSENII